MESKFYAWSAITMQSDIFVLLWYIPGKVQCFFFVEIKEQHFSNAILCCICMLLTIHVNEGENYIISLKAFDMHIYIYSSLVLLIFKHQSCNCSVILISQSINWCLLPLKCWNLWFTCCISKWFFLRIILASAYIQI